MRPCSDGVRCGSLRALRRGAAALLASGACLAGAAGAQAAPLPTEGTNFWLGFPANSYESLTTVQTLYIGGDTATSGKVLIPGMGFSKAFTVTPGKVTPVQLPSGSDMAPAVSDGSEAKGIHVTAKYPVVVNAVDDEAYSTDGYTGLPTSSLGTSYTVLAFGTSSAPKAEFNSELAIVATHPSTSVTITPSVEGGAGGSRAAGVPYTVTLGEGEEYELRATKSEDLTGTTVSTSAPVSVFGGQRCADVPTSAYEACDYMVEQTPPTSAWGTRFLTEPLITRSEDEFQLVAAQNGTEVFVNGSPTATLNAGQHYTHEIAGASEITATKPILLAQYANSLSYDRVFDSDPFMITIPPVTQYGDDALFATPNNSLNLFANYLNVIVPAAGASNMRIDGIAVPSSQFHPIGTSGYDGAQLSLPAGSMEHSIISAGQPFQAFSYGFSSADGYGYPTAAAGPSASAVHWYSDGELITEGTSEKVATSGAVQLTVSGVSSAITCTLKDTELIVNPIGGGAGSDEMTVFTLSSCHAATNPCPGSSHLEVLANGLPWTSTLVPGSPVHDEIVAATFEAKCSNGLVLGTTTKTLSPIIGESVLSFTEPGFIGEDAMKGPAGDVTITAASFTAPHWYSDGVRIGEGQVEPVATSGTLSVAITYVEGGAKPYTVHSTVKCKLVDHENVVNPVGGGAGSDEMTNFELLECKGSPNPCPRATLQLLPLGLPWATELLWTPAILDQIRGFSLEAKCSTGRVLTTISETVTPWVGNSVLAFNGPTVTGSDTLVGPPGDETITANNP